MKVRSDQKKIPQHFKERSGVNSRAPSKDGDSKGVSQEKRRKCLSLSLLLSSSLSLSLSLSLPVSLSLSLSLSLSFSCLAALSLLLSVSQESFLPDFMRVDL